MTVLVIDDEPMITDIAARILVRAGFEVAVANSGLAGIDAFEACAHDIDLILLDLALQDLSGIETLCRIRETRPGLPCILSSGQPLQSGDIPAQLRTCLYFLLKPYRAEVLADLVRRIAANQGDSIEARYLV